MGEELSGYINTSTLIKKLTEIMRPTGEDAKYRLEVAIFIFLK